jgi:hypothetical protein
LNFIQQNGRDLKKKSPPMFLEFYLVFYMIFPKKIIFLKFPNFNYKNHRFLKLDPADPAKFQRFSEKSAGFLNPDGRIWRGTKWVTKEDSRGRQAHYCPSPSMHNPTDDIFLRSGQPPHAACCTALMI